MSSRHRVLLDLLKQRAWERRPMSTPAGVERLERRRLLAAGIDDRVLLVTGGTGNDVIAVTRTGVGEQVRVRVNGTSNFFDGANFDRVIVRGGAGGDTITAGDGIPRVTLDGGSGNDRLTDGNGSNTLAGGDGADTLVAGAGNDSLAGGAGTDVVDYSATTAALSFTGYSHPGGSPASPYVRITSTGQDDRADFDVEHFIGGSGDDRFILFGNPEPEDEPPLPTLRLDGMGGDDFFQTRRLAVSMFGGGGEDTFIAGENSNDSIFGGDGADEISLEDAGRPNLLDAGAGRDTLRAFAIGEVVDASNYIGLEDITDVGFEVRLVIGNALDNRITVQPDATFDATIRGGGGDDTILGAEGADRLEGGEGDDLLIGNGDDDTLDGEAGTDTLYGGPGDDTPLNGEADTPIQLDDGVLVFTGGNGAEQISIWADGAGGLVVWLDGEEQTFDIDDVSRIELHGNGGNDLLKLHRFLAIPVSLVGGDGDDKLIGGAGNDTLLGEEGNDHLTGNGGDDSLDGWLGSDTLYGSAGRDTLTYASRTNPVVVGLDGFVDDGEAGENDFAAPDLERVIGGAGSDRLGGSSGDNVLYGGPGNDTLGGGGGGDALFGEAGNDKLDGGDGDDFLEGGAGHDALYGGGGADTMLGLAGNDRLFSDGDGLRDVVDGGTGTDTADADELDEVTGVETRS